MRYWLAYMVCCVLFFNNIHARHFKDVPPHHWARGSIERLVSLGMITGYQDDVFRGRKSITRYELALYLSNLEKIQSKKIKQLEARVLTLESQLPHKRP